MYSPKYNFHGCTRTLLARRFSAFSSRSFLHPRHYHNQTHRRITTFLECTFHCCICNIKIARVMTPTDRSLYNTQFCFNDIIKKGTNKVKICHNSLVFTNPAAAKWLARTVILVAPVAAVVVAVAAENFLDAARKRALKFVILAHRLLKVCESTQTKWGKLKMGPKNSEIWQSYRSQPRPSCPGSPTRSHTSSSRKCRCHHRSETRKIRICWQNTRKKISTG
jgi:hypothetical protein